MQGQKEKRTEISDLGEFGLIDRISASFKNQQPTTIFGIGDDGAILQSPINQQIVISTDLLAEGVHFDLSFTPLQHLGYKAVVVNLSDMAAMNAIPHQITVSIALSNRFSLEAVDALYEGIRMACTEYKVDLVGGDTTSSRSGLVISVTAIGYQKEDKIVRRSGAKIGDLVCVTGDLGAAYMGLQLLSREKKVFEVDPDMQPELKEEYAYLLQRQLKPEARMDVVYDLADAGILPNAMMDISDGLASEILHLAKQSGVGIHIFEDKLPIENLTKLSASELGLSPLTCAMNGGEDYELLFTILQSDYEKINALSEVSIIGIVKEHSAGNWLLLKSNQAVEIKAQGWAHF